MWLIVLLVAATLAASSSGVAQQPLKTVQFNRPGGNGASRTVLGTVRDEGGEPLRGAVVEIEAEDSMTIASYITGEKGEFHFHNLRGDADYHVWASFRGHHSKHHEISKLERKPEQDVVLVIDLVKDEKK